MDPGTMAPLPAEEKTNHERCRKGENLGGSQGALGKNQKHQTVDVHWIATRPSTALF